MEWQGRGLVPVVASRFAVEMEDRAGLAGAFLQEGVLVVLAEQAETEPALAEQIAGRNLAHPAAMVPMLLPLLAK